MTTETNTIADLLKTEIKATAGSLADLRGRIESLIESLPVGTILADDAGEIGRIEDICTGASQWSNRTWDVTIRGVALIVGLNNIAAETCDRQKWDGNNMHHHSDEAFCLHGPHGIACDFLSASKTRELAKRLPAAIERYMIASRIEREANESTMVSAQ